LTKNYLKTNFTKNIVLNSLMKKIDIMPLALRGPVFAYAARYGDKTILVDTGYPGEEEDVCMLLHQYGIKMTDISLIVLTQARIDHYGSAPALRRLLCAPIAITSVDAPVLRHGEQFPDILISPVNWLLYKRYRKKYDVFSERIKPFNADIIVNDQLPLASFGLPGFLLHTPGPTAGSLSVVFEDGQAIIGDLLTRTVLTRNIIGSARVFDKALMKRSLRTLLALGPAVFYTSHSRPIKVEENRKRIKKLITDLK
jgi:hydroxyacylglutathione hydrolase